MTGMLSQAGTYEVRTKESGSDFLYGQNRIETDQNLDSWRTPTCFCYSSSMYNAVIVRRLSSLPCGLPMLSVANGDA